jgi:hypothetical protein
MHWRKSSYSSSTGNCVEVDWRKSSFSSDTANCVEVAPSSNTVRVRDSKNVTGPMLSFSDEAYRYWLASAIAASWPAK